MSQELGSFLATIGLIAAVALFVPCVQWMLHRLKQYQARKEAAAGIVSAGRAERAEFSEEVA